jgi:hypothetical protein
MNKTVFLSASSEPDSSEPQGEARMREALGLRIDGTRVTPVVAHRPERQMDHGSGGNPRRHRFVQEGEVPVEVMSLRDHSSRAASTPGGNTRHRVDENALAAERLARELAERAFSELSDRHRELQTKLGHAELARDEAITLAARRQSQIDLLLAQPPPEPIIIHVPAPVAPEASVKVRKVKAVATPRPRGRGKAPQPVKWWIKSTLAPE